MTDQPNDLTRKVFRAEIAAVNTHLAETVPSAPADADLRYQVLHALDFAYCNGIGYETPEQLLDAYDAHRPVLPAPADRAAVLREAAVELRKQTLLHDDCVCLGELRRMADETQQAEPLAADCPYGVGPGDGSGCIKPAGHDGDHVVTAGVPVDPCSRAVLHQPHIPHSWWPQPGMAYVHCPGATTEAQTCGAWGDCTLPASHNMGHADIPENHSTGKAQQAGEGR